MKLLVALLILVLSTLTQAQTPENDALFGTFNVRPDAARIRLATNSPATPVSFWTLSFDFTNGPPEEIFYRNQTFGIGYNVDFNGNPIVPSEVSFSFNNETKFRNGVAGQPGSFMSEHHFNWKSPFALVQVRPFGWTVDYDTGKFDIAIHGKMHFFRDFINGGSKWGTWHDDGALDLSDAPNGRIAFKNNHPGITWGNAAGNNSINPVRVDNFDRVVIGGGQQETLINSAKLAYANPQCGPIPDSNGSAQDNARAINSFLACMRERGMVAQGSSNAKRKGGGKAIICFGDDGLARQHMAERHN